MALLYDNRNLVIREVKNLGWLLRHHRHVTAFRVRFTPGLFSEAVLEVVLDPETSPSHTARYEVGFASKIVLWEWLDRPVFQGLPLLWGNVASRIGD